MKTNFTGLVIGVILISVLSIIVILTGFYILAIMAIMGLCSLALYLIHTLASIFNYLENIDISEKLNSMFTEVWNELEDDNEN